MKPLSVHRCSSGFQCEGTTVYVHSMRDDCHRMARFKVTDEALKTSIYPWVESDRWFCQSHLRQLYPELADVMKAPKKRLRVSA